MKTITIILMFLGITFSLFVLNEEVVEPYLDTNLFFILFGGLFMNYLFNKYHNNNTTKLIKSDAQ